MPIEIANAATPLAAQRMRSVWAAPSPAADPSDDLTPRGQCSSRWEIMTKPDPSTP